MKRIACLILSFILLFSLLACAKEELTPKNVKSVDDIYSLDDDKMNFSTLYVVENNGGIVTFVYDMYEHWQDYEGEPKWAVAKVTLGNTLTYESGDYTIISFAGDMSPSQLQLGDEVICHHNYSLMTQIYPAEMTAYNLFFTGGHKQIDTYLGFPDENGIPELTP